jgi:FecR protein
VFGCLMALALFASTRAVGAAKPTAIVTILQGSATVIRAVSQFSAIEGIRLLSEDLIRTEKDGFLRIEYEDGTWIELGPETQLELAHPSERRGKGPGLYLLSGWMKLDCAPSENGKGSLASTGMDLSDISDTFVIRTVEATHAIFAELGTARWMARTPHATEAITLKRGDFLITGKGGSPQVQNGPSPDFVRSMPVEFRDTLPIRYAQFASRNVVVKDQTAFGYADVEQWLNAEPWVRRQFVQLWRRKAAQDEAFRSALDHSMSLHPEWDPVLHPEKYEKD